MRPVEQRPRRRASTASSLPKSSARGRSRGSRCAPSAGPQLPNVASQRTEPVVRLVRSAGASRPVGRARRVLAAELDRRPRGPDRVEPSRHQYASSRAARSARRARRARSTSRDARRRRPVGRSPGRRGRSPDAASRRRGDDLELVDDDGHVRPLTRDRGPPRSTSWPGREPPRVLDAVGAAIACQSTPPAPPRPRALAASRPRAPGVERLRCRASAAPPGRRRACAAPGRTRSVIFCCDSASETLARSGRPSGEKNSSVSSSDSIIPSNWNVPQTKRTAGGRTAAALADRRRLRARCAAEPPGPRFGRDEVGDLLRSARARRRRGAVPSGRPSRRTTAAARAWSCRRRRTGAPGVPRWSPAPAALHDLVGEGDLQRLGVELHLDRACRR